MRIVCDTNILIEHLDDHAQWRGLMDAIGSGTLTGVVSIVTEYELLAFPNMTEAQEGAASFLLQAFTIHHLDHRIVNIAAMLRRRYKRKALDLMIAATAIDLGIPLLTRNLRDFKGIAGLDVFNTLPNGIIPTP